jgi:LacI family transcriptional regulator, repressor for deo operon, udp, cdd, tsx, nupC, and nupG
MRTKSRTRPGPAKTEMATIYDVARVAGVSTATVSRALANPDVVAPATRDRVNAAARELGYAPNISARTIRANAKMVLALIPRLGSPFFTPFLDSVTDLLSESGLCVVVADLRGSLKKEAHYARLINQGQFAGVILFTGRIPKDGTVDAAAALRIPIVLACNEIPGTDDLPVFDVADRDAARRMVSYLISIGHRRIAHIRGPEGNIEAEERLAGYTEALRAAGISLEDDLVWTGDFYLGSGIEAAGRFLARAERPTAVFAGNDQMAMGFITELKNAGIAVPRDVSVAGFDDIEYSVIFDPPLTTMHQPRAEIGRLAALELLRQINRADTGAKPGRVRLDCELVIRESTQPLRLSVDGNVRAAERNVRPGSSRGTRTRKIAASL